MNCPDCGHENIPGADSCEKCGQSLTGMQIPGSEIEQSIIAHPVSVLATKAPFSIDQQVIVRDAIQTMVDRKVGCLLITEDDVLSGIFTERDVLNRITPDPAAMEQPVGNHMSRTPARLKADDSIAYALHTMSINGYRHLPVVDAEDKPVSIVSSRDILRLLAVRFADIRSD
ncbi:MAG: CBS domain-containing protein [Planctomycetota bacterium]|mgnify:CR=1 FL=1|nr:MAG: CBS domain-containing protein [Planctomycetota bacterium]REJ97000.1 MAG: CBS domain-containing protein [Planctomycetota bacterium]REK20123.1 MAG: CBS domain-containing protein [Planctomycetota bacterium]REK34313.1 MAG: CBS domain-containing protein [Planctomycetota bacterium]